MTNEKFEETVKTALVALIEHSKETDAQLQQLGVTVKATSATVAALGTKVEETSTKVEETSATVAALSTKVAETTRSVNKLIADAEADKQRQKQNDLKFNNLLHKVDKIAKLHGNLSNNIGTVAETFFVKALEKTKELMGLKFHVVRRNVGTVKEFDIVMINDDVIIIISVKHILHVRDVEKFLKEDLKQVPILFPEFRTYKLYGGVAGMHVNADARALASDAGLIVLGQAGRNAAVLNERDFNPRVMND